MSVTNMLPVTMHELHRWLNTPVLMPAQLQNTDRQRHICHGLQVPGRILRCCLILEFVLVHRVHRRDLFSLGRPTNDFNLHPMPSRIRMPQHIHLTGTVPGRQLFAVDDADISRIMHAVSGWIVR